MKDDEKFSVEPLSEAAWGRVERAVFEQVDTAAAETQPPRLPHRLALTLGVVAAVQMAAAVFLLLNNAQDASPAPLASTRIVTERDGSDTMFGDVSIRLEPASALVAIETPAGGSLVVLERGAALFAVPPRNGRPAFSVQAGAVRVEVIGTRFRVRRGNAIQVETFEGKVRVIAGGRATPVSAGESWTDVPAPRAEAPATPPPASEPAAAEPAPTPPAAAPVRRPAGDDRRARFEQAALLEASRPSAALRLYAHLAAEGGPWGQTALYAQGRLELELGRRANAARLLRRYLRDHPGGANAADVRALLARLPPELAQEDE